VERASEACALPRRSDSFRVFFPHTRRSSASAKEGRKLRFRTPHSAPKEVERRHRGVAPCGLRKRSLRPSSAEAAASAPSRPTPAEAPPSARKGDKLRFRTPHVAP